MIFYFIELVFLEYQRKDEIQDKKIKRFSIAFSLTNFGKPSHE